jgi:hypothetical protein
MVGTIYFYYYYCWLHPLDVGVSMVLFGSPPGCIHISMGTSNGLFGSYVDPSNFFFPSLDSSTAIWMHPTPCLALGWVQPYFYIFIDFSLWFLHRFGEVGDNSHIRMRDVVLPDLGTTDF